MNRTVVNPALQGVSYMDESEDESAHAGIRAEALHLLEAKIDRLPDAFRTVFVLRALEEMTAKDVADCLCIPEATVRARFFKARGLLREALAREIDGACGEAFAFDGPGCDRVVHGVNEKLRDLKETDRRRHVSIPGRTRTAVPTPNYQRNPTNDKSKDQT